jgi:hypothetical protein
MAKAVFEGLIFDESDNQLPVAFVGAEPCYVLDDDGFKLHIPSEGVDRQILNLIRIQIEENKELITEQAVNMMGENDLFTHAIIQNQLDNIEDQMDLIFKQGLPESSKAYLGILGFKVVIDHHGDIIRVDQPSAPAPEDE